MDYHFFKDLLARKGGALTAVGALCARGVGSNDEWTARLAFAPDTVKHGNMILFLLNLERWGQTRHVVEQASQCPYVHFKVKWLTF